MKVYIVIWETNNGSPVATTFTTKEKAIEWARKEALYWNKPLSSVDETEMVNCLYHVVVKKTGETLWVQEEDIDSAYDSLKKDEEWHKQSEKTHLKYKKLRQQKQQGIK